MTLGEIVKKNYRTAEVFDKFNLDFCCNGGKKLEEACKKSEIDPQQVVDALNAINFESGDDMNFDSWPLDLLADYIQKRHHKYVEERIPVIKTYLERIASVHGIRHPELVEIQQLFSEIAGEIAVHLKKEELMVFPYIKKIVKAKASGSAISSSLFPTINNPVEALKEDHAAEGEKFHKISTLSNQYTTPSDGCSTYQVTYRFLKEFEQDLHRHIHLENNILFPKAVEMEKGLSPSAFNSMQGGKSN